MARGSRPIRGAVDAVGSAVRGREAAIAAGGAAATVAADRLRARLSDHREPLSRAYRFERDEPVDEGIRRIARGRLENAISELRGEAGSTPAVAVHEARKDLKKLRSVLRLARKPLGDEVYRAENDFYRDAGRELSELRDAEVMIEALDGLTESEDGAGGDAPWLREALAARRREVTESGAEQEAMASVAGRLEAGLERVERWWLRGRGWDLIESGLRRSYRRGRNRFRDVGEDPSTENLHEWRKRVKDLWYQTRLIKPAEPQPIGGLVDQLDDLSDHLGDDHDLAVLRSEARRLAGERETSGGLAELEARIDRRRGQLQFAAISDGKRIYDQKPKRFVAAIAARWDEWRS